MSSDSYSPSAEAAAVRLALGIGDLLGVNTVGGAPWPDPPADPHTPVVEAEEESFPTDASQMPPRAPRLERTHAMVSRGWDLADFPPPPVLEPAPAPRNTRERYVADEMPALYARALENHGGATAPWDYESARRALEDAVDALSVPGGRYLPVMYTYSRATGGLTFRMLLMSEESIVPDADGIGSHATHTGVARPVNDYGISHELALRWLTYDYLEHRMRQLGVGLRDLIGTPAFSARGRELMTHQETYMAGLNETYDTLLSYITK
jgi:hypothetical protein